jgi:uncharacterized NAD-dependent epimerase/dehydratase family protein
MDVKVEAFLTDQDGHQASIRSIRPINEPLAESEATLVVVGGTSAEVGKTTFICRAIRAIRKHSGATAIAGLKAVGTGRLRDILSYKDAGAANVVDFVSMGWPTTYNVPVAEYRRLFERMLIRGSTGNKFVFIEIGGDLLTEAAGVVLDEAGRRSAIGILCANDAMGAMTGLRLFAEASVPVSIISTFRQNQQAMAERLGWTSVVNAFDQEAMAEVATILTKPASHRRLRPN